MRAKLVCAVVFLCGFSCPILGQRVLLGTISVEAFDPFGGKLEASSIHLYTTDRQKDLAGNRGTSTIRDVPYGRYLLVVTSAGGGVASREIVVNVPQSWIVIGVPMPVGTVEWPAGNLTVRGKVGSESVAEGFWWARIAGTFTSMSKEARLRSNGTFEIGGLEMGAYVISIYRGSQVKYVKNIEIDTRNRVAEITIP